MTPQQPVAEAQRSTSPPGGTVLTPGSMEVIHMVKWEEGGDATVIFANSKEGVEALRRLEARIEKARREGKIIPPEKRRYVSEPDEADDSSKIE
jgi:hypothetical protein